ncbi:MAG: hypothetical protein ACJZ8Y_10070 [Pirellulaceae bacterium]|tara:strand:- start:23411 stop:23881 length:471 start_codon:yes stop_codon:yes gene_type:complete
MSVFTDIKDLAEGKSQSKEWYRSQLMYALEPYDGAFAPGDIIFYRYAAATEKLPFYDTYPMTIISDVDYSNLQFSGGNCHYLRPTTRKSVCQSWASGSIAYPTRCYHKYFMSNATNIMKVPKEYLNNMTPLPVEQFVLRAAGRLVEVPSSFIWGKL